MRKILILFIIGLLTSTFLAIKTEAKVQGTTEKEIVVKKHPKPLKEEIPEKEGRRLPSNPYLCTIDKEVGVQVHAFEGKIETYEILDIQEGICIVSFEDERDFTTSLFSLTGAYMIRFTTEEYELVGYIEM